MYTKSNSNSLLQSPINNKEKKTLYKQHYYKPIFAKGKGRTLDPTHFETSLLDQKKFQKMQTGGLFSPQCLFSNNESYTSQNNSHMFPDSKNNKSVCFTKRKGVKSNRINGRPNSPNCSNSPNIKLASIKEDDGIRSRQKVKERNTRNITQNDSMHSDTNDISMSRIKNSSYMYSQYSKSQIGLKSTANIISKYYDSRLDASMKSAKSHASGLTVKYMGNLSENMELLSNRLTRQINNALDHHTSSDPKGPPAIFGVPFDVILAPGKSSTKTIELKTNTFCLIKLIYENFEGSFSVSINNHSNIQYYLANKFATLANGKYDYYFNVQNFKLEVPLATDPTDIKKDIHHNKELHMKVYAVTGCEFDILFQCSAGQRRKTLDSNNNNITIKSAKASNFELNNSY